jgi:hypothetical protein
VINFVALFKAFNTAMTLRDLAKQVAGSGSSAATGVRDAAAGGQEPIASGPGSQLETRLGSVVVAALKEAFDRDHARLELERAHLDEQRRRADEALRLEMRRQAVDREVGRLRLLAGTALIGWVASVLVLVVRRGDVATASRTVMAVGWLLLLGARAAAVTAQSRLGAGVGPGSTALEPGRAGSAALWLLTLGLAVAGASLLV